MSLHEDEIIQDDKSFKFYRADRQNIDWDPMELEAVMATKKEKRIIVSVVRNSVSTLKQLLDAPKWYRVVDKHCENLLHIAILQNSKECFDYMLSIPDFPLEMMSNYGETALITAILVVDLKTNGLMKPGDDYYAWQLIKRGANIFYCDKFGYSTLLCAALKHHIKMATFFIEKGLDIDQQDISGDTALHQALDHDSPDAVEFVSLLLHHGANPRVKNKEGLMPFEKSAISSRNSFLQELLFYYTYDENSPLVTYLSVVLELARYDSPLVTKFDDVIVDDCAHMGYIHLFYLDLSSLETVLRKFRKAIGIGLHFCYLHEWSRNAITLEKIELFMQNGLEDDMISCIQNQEDVCLLQYLIQCDLDENIITDIFMYLLSYGLDTTEECVQRVYQEFGYRDLFKMLLHMNIKMGVDEPRQILPHLLYDVMVDLEYYFLNFHLYSIKGVDRLLCYFVNSELREICDTIYDTNIASRLKELPKIPMLVELARNVFRKYFICRFQIHNSVSFYTLLNNLEINDIYKKIITYEKKLY